MTMTMTMTMTNTSLTRYLYRQSDVEQALKWALFEHQEAAALFWAYELYYSGLEVGVWKLLTEFTKWFFQERHPDLVLYFKRHAEYGTVDEDEIALGTIVKTMVHGQPSFAHFLRSAPSLYMIPSNTVYHTMKPEYVVPYHTPLLATHGHRWLDKVCLFPRDPRIFPNFTKDEKYEVASCGMKTEEVPSFEELRDHHLYYANYTPLWAQRILQYDGRVDHDQRCIVFDDDESEAFHELYNYEPDEQPLSVQERLWSTTMIPVSWSEFCRTYGPYNEYVNIQIKIKRKKTNS